MVVGRQRAKACDRLPCLARPLPGFQMGLFSFLSTRFGHCLSLYNINISRSRQAARWKRWTGKLSILKGCCLLVAGWCLFFFVFFFPVIICETPSEGGRAQDNAGQSLSDVAGSEQRAAMCFGERERCGSRLPKSKGRGRCRSAACGDAEWLGTTLAGMGMALASPRFEVEVGPILLPPCGFWVISPLGAMAQEAACGRRFPSLASLFPILHLPLLPDAVPRG